MGSPANYLLNRLGITQGQITTPPFVQGQQQAQQPLQQPFNQQSGSIGRAGNQYYNLGKGIVDLFKKKSQSAATGDVQQQPLDNDPTGYAAYADGGVAYGRTEATLAEDEPEYIVPESKIEDFVDETKATGKPPDPSEIPGKDKADQGKNFTPIPPSMRQQGPPMLAAPGQAPPNAPPPPPPSPAPQQPQPAGGPPPLAAPGQPLPQMAPPPAKQGIGSRILGAVSGFYGGAVDAAGNRIGGIGGAIQGAEDPSRKQRMADFQVQMQRQKMAADIGKTQAETTEAQSRGKYYEGENSAHIEERQVSAKARTDAAKTQANQRQMANLLRGRQEDATYQKEGDPVPPGYETIQDIENPGYVYVVPPARVKVTDDLARYMPGRKVGDIVPYSEVKAAQAAAQKNIITNLDKPEKPDKDPANEVALALAAARGDQAAQKALRLIQQNKQTAGVQLSPEAIDYWAKMASVTGQLPSMGMGNSGATARGQVLNRAPQIDAGGDVAANKANYHADSGSLAAQQKMRDSVVAFENTANANLDLFAKAAKPVIDSGSPLVNTPLRAINQKALGSQDLAAYNAARQVALTEISKVVNNPSLSGQLSDSARKEVTELIPENATLGQIYRVVGVLKQDMANRHQSLDQSIATIKGRIGGGRGGSQDQGNQAQQSTAPIRVRRKSDGQTGSLDPKDFDPAKYEKM